MGKSKKLLFISTRPFWKLDGGHQYEIFHYLRGLREQYGYEIHVYTFLESESGDNLSGIPEYIDEVIIASTIKKIDIFKNFILHIFNTKEPWPLQNMLYFSKSNVKQIKVLINRINPDVVYVDMERLAPYIVAFADRESCLKVLGYDDLLSERYMRQLAVKSEKAKLAGAYSDKLPSIISKLQYVKAIKNFVLRFEADRMKKSELYYAKQYDSGIFVSNIESRKFNKIIGRNFAHTVAMGIDYEYQSENIHVQKEENTFSFVGNLKTAANFETVVYIIDDILTHVQSEYKFYVYGVCPDELKNRYSEKRNIIFMGRVEDLRKAIKSTMVFLSPIAFGTGIKTKILEAFAMGMPVITNSVGIEGIEVENGKHCFISDDAEELAHELDVLLHDQEKRMKLAQNAQMLAKERYQWEENWKGFAEAGL